MPRKSSSKLKAFLRREIEKKKIKAPEDIYHSPQRYNEYAQKKTHASDSPYHGDDKSRPLPLTSEEQTNPLHIHAPFSDLARKEHSTTGCDLVTAPEFDDTEGDFTLNKLSARNRKKPIQRVEAQDHFPPFEPLPSQAPPPTMVEIMDRIKSLREALVTLVEHGAPSSSGEWRFFETQRLTMVEAIAHSEHRLELEKRKALIVDSFALVPEPIHPARIRKARLGVKGTPKRKRKLIEIPDEDLVGEERYRMGKRLKKTEFQPTGHWKHIQRGKSEAKERPKKRKEPEIPTESDVETTNIEYEGEERSNNRIAIAGIKKVIHTKISAAERKATIKAQQKAEEGKTPKLWEYIRKGGHMRKWKR